MLGPGTGRRGCLSAGVVQSCTDSVPVPRPPVIRGSGKHQTREVQAEPPVSSQEQLPVWE